MLGFIDNEYSENLAIAVIFLVFISQFIFLIPSVTSNYALVKLLYNTIKKKRKKKKNAKSHRKRPKHYKKQIKQVTEKTDEILQTNEEKRPSIIPFLQTPEQGSDPKSEPKPEQETLQEPNKEIILDFAGSLEEFNAISDQELEEMTRKLPNGMQSLSINLRLCNTLTSQCVRNIADCLTPSLTKLELNFSGTWGKSGFFTDNEITVLTAHIPNSLSYLSLDFASCSQITDIGIIWLSAALPQELTHLNLNFCECFQISEDGFKYLVKFFPPKLNVLKLNFSGNYGNSGNVTDEVLSSFSLPALLQTLVLELWGNKHITNKGIKNIVDILPQNLQSLSLNFTNCIQLSDHGLKHFESLSRSLTKALLNFWNCDEVSSSAKSSLVTKLKHIKELTVW